MSSLSDLITLSSGFDRNKLDATVAKDAIAFDPEMKLGVPEWGATFAVTETALAQLRAKLGPAVFGKGSTRSIPGEYLDRCPKPLAAIQYNYWMPEVVNGRGWFIRRYGTDVRAILDGGYPAISNTDVLQTLDDLLADPENTYPDQQLVRSFVGPDAVHVRMLFVNTHREDPGNDGTLYLGVHVENDEIGGGALKVSGMIWNGGCTNSIRLNNTVKITHQYRVIGSVEWMTNQLLAALGQVLATSPAYLDKFIAAQTRKLPRLGAVIAELAKEHKWDDTTRANVGVGSNGQETLAGLLNGITYAAQRQQKQDAVVAMEELAGEYLTDDSGLFALATKVVARENVMAVVQ